MNRFLPPGLCLVAALLMILPVALEPGWPLNQENVAPFERVEAFRRAFAAYDFLPTWTPFCFHGHGSPLPLIYHRLFNWTGGLLALPLGASLGTRVAIVAFAWLGAVGMFRAARRLDVSPVRSLLVAVAFLWSPYSVIDWLVRGSVAEFASMMLMPWLVEAVLRQLQGEKAWLRLGLTMAALLHAHQSLAMYAAALPVLSTVAVVVNPATRGSRVRRLGDALLAAVVAAVLTLPWLIAVARSGDAFRLSVFSKFLPWNRYAAWDRFLYDQDYKWGQGVLGVSVEVSRWVVAALMVSVVAALVSRTRPRHGQAVVVMVLMLAAMVALQFDVATPFYRGVPYAALLQFPWRLLAIITPLSCLLLGVACEAAASRHRVVSWIATTMLVFVVVQHGLLVRTAEDMQYPAMPAARVDTAIAQLDGPASLGEYLPRATPSAPPPSAWVDVGACTATRVEPAVPTHFRSIEVDLAAGPACVVRFSQFSTPLLEVEGDGVRVERGPLVTVEVPAGGARSLRLRRRNLWELAFR